MKREQCSKCNSPASIERGNYQFDEMGLPVVLRRIKLVKCQRCGNVDPIIPHVNDLMHAIAWAVIGQSFKLDGREIRFLRKYVGKSAREFAKLLHIDHTHLSKVENEHVDIGDAADKLVRFVVINLSPELKGHVNQLLASLPAMKDSSEEKLEIQINPDTMEILYA